MGFEFFTKNIDKNIVNKLIYPTMQYPIFFNSIPKSGTHLLSKAMMGLPNISHSGYHLERKMIAKFVDEGVDYPLEGREDIHIPNDLPWIERLLNMIQPGQYITSHMYYNPPMHNLLKKRNFKPIIMLRDPRDVVLSWANYVQKEETHLLFPYFSQKDFDFCVICGIKGIDKETTGTRRQPPISELIQRHYRWVTEAGAFLVRFEDVIGERGGGSKQTQVNLLKNLVEFFEIECNDKTINSICDDLFGGTYTFNKGMIGRWRDEFTEEHKQLFKEEAGPLLVDLGYEKDLNW